MRLTGIERRELRAILQEAFSRPELIRALAESDLALEWEDIVTKGTFDDELHDFLMCAQRRGWLPRVLPLLEEKAPDRQDLLTRARAIVAAAEKRHFVFEPTRPIYWVPALAVTTVVLAGAIWYFFFRVTGDEPNFIVTVQKGAPPQPVAGQKVFVGKASETGAPEDPQIRVTNGVGQAFFRLPVGSDRIYLGGVELEEGAAGHQCQFPAFLLTSIRSITHNLSDLNCLETMAGSGPDKRALRVAAAPVNVATATFPPDVPGDVQGMAIPTRDWRRRLPQSARSRALRAPFGLPDAPTSIDRNFYSLGFDPQFRVPVWVSYVAHSVNDHDLRRRPTRILWDPAIPRELQCDPEDYRGNPYDLGHLIPRQDAVRTPATREAALEAEREINVYSLVVPQPGKTNQITWVKVEQLTTEASTKLGPIYVTAGPVYPRERNMPFLVIGPGKTPVPTALYRVLLRKTPAGAWKAIAFVVPNDGSVEADPTKFRASVADVEKQTGVVFFPSMDATLAKQLKQSSDLSRFLEER